MTSTELPSGPGITFAPFESRADVIVRTAQLADRSGFGAFSLAEAAGNASPPLLAEIALTTENLELATCVLAVWSRSPAVLAMTATGLQRISRGRFVLGLGASTPPLVEGLHGTQWAAPIDTLRSALTSVRALLEGRRLPYPAGGARPLGLSVAPEQPIPLALASLTPRTIQMAGELADRWLPFLWPRSQLVQGRRLLADGAATASRASLPAIMPAVSGWTDAGADRVDIVLPIGADEAELQVILRAVAPLPTRVAATAGGDRQ